MLAWPGEPLIIEWSARKALDNRMGAGKALDNRKGARRALDN